MIRRREFITGLGGAAAAWPLAARAQRPVMPVIGFLNAGTAPARAHFVAAFRQGLKELGYIDGENVTLEYRWAEDQLDRMSVLAADLVRRQANVIVTGSSEAITRAAKAAATTIPIVFVTDRDPVKAGFVASLNRPGGNATGVSYLSGFLAQKRLGLLRELAPLAATVGVLINMEDAPPDTVKELETAATITGQTIEFFHASTGPDMEAAFGRLLQKRPDALLLVNSTLFFSRHVQVLTLATRLGIPAIFTGREYSEAGGLMSYGTNIADAYRQAGVLAARILKGEKPADLPVLQATKFEFVINLQTAKILGISIPPMLLALADVVIE
jgi:putative ABC transport system substrate-binding protein